MPTLLATEDIKAGMDLTNVVRTTGDDLTLQLVMLGLHLFHRIWRIHTYHPVFSLMDDDDFGGFKDTRCVLLS